MKHTGLEAVNYRRRKRKIDENTLFQIIRNKNGVRSQLILILENIVI